MSDLFGQQAPAGLLAEPFPCFSRHSASPIDVDHAARLAEIERELAHRIDAYPRFVDRDVMTQAEANAGIAAWTAIAHDARAIGMPGPFEPHPLSWHAKLDTLRREILDRRGTYARQIEREVLTIADARQRLSAIEAVHWDYWAGLRAWCPSSALDDRRRAAIWAHCEAIDALGNLTGALQQRLAFPQAAAAA